MKFSIITGTIGALLLVLTMSTVGHTAPKYVTVCKLYGNAGNAIECKLVPYTAHVSPDPKWSAYRLHRETLPPVKTTLKGGN